MTVRAVIFDMDGVLVDSEPVWEDVRRSYVIDRNGDWPPDTQRRLMGMSTDEWAEYLAGRLVPGESVEDVAYQVIDRMTVRYADAVPLLPGAVETVRRLAARYPLGLASSSPRALIDLVLGQLGIAGHFLATVSTEEVDRGKPAPDVYRAVAAQMAADPAECLAIEDSAVGLRAARAAGMRLIAVPRPHFPPGEDALCCADVVAGSLAEITDDLVLELGESP
ncbi:HAD family hydrolase [Actinomadura atramentaria]|uniref:HAD family hydrolase n=1 Tax=Actinomadura atramentaria TaxID=1990 RepID=UPI00039D0E88|nr:HAD family phosphatase [Actinomadura atramentaria]